MSLFLTLSVVFALVMLIWDCVEVGRNDAANLVNAAFGARVLRRRTAVWIAGDQQQCPAAGSSCLRIKTLADLLQMDL